MDKEILLRVGNEIFSDDEEIITKRKRESFEDECIICGTKGDYDENPLETSTYGEVYPDEYRGYPEAEDKVTICTDCLESRKNDY